MLFCEHRFANAGFLLRTDNRIFREWLCCSAGDKLQRDFRALAVVRGGYRGEQQNDVVFVRRNAANSVPLQPQARAFIVTLRGSDLFSVKPRAVSRCLSPATEAQARLTLSGSLSSLPFTLSRLSMTRYEGLVLPKSAVISLARE